MSRTPNKTAILNQRVKISPKVDIPAPVGGLNTRDNRGEMPLQDAIVLDNFIPENESVAGRGGYVAWTDDLTGTVESLMPYISGTTQELIAASDGKWNVIDVNQNGTSTQIATGLTNNRWQFINFNQFLVAVNGQDAPRSYNGTTVATLSYSGDIATPGAATMDGIHAHKSRVYLWDTDTNDFYYGATNAISGAFSLFPLGTVSTTGGNLIAMKTLSFDAGFGLDDLAVFFLSTGETLVYQGSDPGDATNWALVGRYFLPPIINVRSAVEFAGDIRVITNTDVISMLEQLRGEGKEIRPSKLTGSIKDNTSLYSSNFGWQAIYYNADDLLIYNVPTNENSTAIQFITNTSTGSSARFTGINANCFGIWNNDIYFGNGSVVYKLFEGQNDNGANIALVAQQAFSTLGVSLDKRIVSYDMLLGSEGDVSIGLAMAYNYNDTLTPSVSASATTGSVWDVAEWNEAPWSSGTQVRVKRFGVVGTGFSVSAKISLEVKGQDIKWYKSNYVFDQMIVR